MSKNSLNSPEIIKNSIRFGNKIPKKPKDIVIYFLDGCKHFNRIIKQYKRYKCRLYIKF